MVQKKLYIETVLDEIKQSSAGKSVNAEHLFELNEAAFNMSEEDNVDTGIASKIFNTIEMIRSLYKSGKFDNTDCNFFHDYLAMLGTMQNQHFFSQKQTEKMLGWMREVMDDESLSSAPQGASANDSKALKDLKADYAALQKKLAKYESAETSAGGGKKAKKKAESPPPEAKSKGKGKGKKGGQSSNNYDYYDYDYDDYWYEDDYYEAPPKSKGKGKGKGKSDDSPKGQGKSDKGKGKGSGKDAKGGKSDGKGNKGKGGRQLYESDTDDSPLPNRKGKGKGKGRKYDESDTDDSPLPNRKGKGKGKGKKK